MDNLLSVSRSQKGIDGALSMGTLENLLRIYENTVPSFLSETEDEVYDFNASMDDKCVPISLTVDLIKVSQCLRNFCTCQDNVIYVHERGRLHGSRSLSGGLHKFHQRCCQ